MFKLTFLTPEKKLVIDQEIDMVIVPAERGNIQILKNHAPLITTLGTGIMQWKLKSEDQIRSVVISWGYCEVSPSGVSVLADIADQVADINVDDCKDYLKKAETRLANEFLDDTQWESVQREVARVRADLELVQQKSHS